MKSIYKSITVLSILFLFLFSASVLGQISKSVSAVNASPAKQGDEQKISVELFQANAVSRINFFYRAFGESSYKSREVNITGVRGDVAIPGDEVAPPAIEYYLMLELKDGNIETYPIDFDKTKIPLTIKVEPAELKENDIILLSPESGFNSASRDLLISVSLLRVPVEVDKEKTKLFLDDADVTSNAVAGGDIINYYPDNFEPKLSPGQHSVKIVLYDTAGKEYSSYKTSVIVKSAEARVFEKGEFAYKIDINGEIRNEKLGDNSMFYNNLGVNFTGEYEDWRIKSNIYLTSEEKSYRQPYNRYSISVQNNFLTLSAGDVFPRFTSLTLDGKRVRGIYGDIKTPMFEVKSVYGQIARATDGRILEKYASTIAPLGTDIIDIDSAKYGASKARAVLGEYERTLLAIRAAVGSDNGLLWGFNYLHSKDDVGSIEFGAKPKENLVVGTDFALAIDNRNVLLTAQAALSMSNKDISLGELSDALIDTVFKKDGGFGGGISPDKVKDLKKIFGKFITVNQYINPFNPEELSTFAAESALLVNYFGNSFKFYYMYRGNDFQSFGQLFTRTDVNGFGISDNARLIDDKVLLSLNYERLQDNLQNTKFATTTYQTLGASVSIFPKADFPTIVVGYNRYNNNNDIDSNDVSKAPYRVDDITNRVFAQFGYGFTLGVKQQASFSISVSDRTDKSPLYYDVSNTSAYFSLNTYWNEGLTSFFNLSINSSKIKDINLDYTGFSIGARQSLLEKRLEVGANINPTFGDLKRVTYDINSRYNINADFSLNFQLRLLTYTDIPNDLIVSLSARYAIN
jgi:hypothetical protein